MIQSGPSGGAVLCPVDLSPASRTALHWARVFAERYHAQVEVLFADWLEWPPYFTRSQAGELAAQARHHRAALREQLAGIAEEALGSNVPHDVVIQEGRPAETILERAAARRARLVAMGSHGRSGLSRLRLGSVAEDVVRQATAPTLIVRPAPTGQAPPTISRVLCPVSFTELARQCLELSSDVAATFGAQLVVVHAVEEASVDLEGTHEALCRWIPGAVRRRCGVVEVVRRRPAAEQILLLAREQAVDLIVIGAQHRPFLEFTTLGSTTERVMRHADLPVLVRPWSEPVSSW